MEVTFFLASSVSSATTIPVAIVQSANCDHTVLTAWRLLSIPAFRSPFVWMVVHCSVAEASISLKLHLVQSLVMISPQVSGLTPAFVSTASILAEFEA